LLADYKYLIILKRTRNNYYVIFEEADHMQTDDEMRDEI